MSGRTYFIDPVSGDDTRDGLTASRPRKTHDPRPVQPGDTVRFKRGTVIPGTLFARSGEAGAVVTYGAYGVGPKPIFLGSVPANSPEKWVEHQPGIWRWTDSFPSAVGNLIFNRGDSCGNFRWSLAELRAPGEWHYSPEPHDSLPPNKPTLYLCSPGNPGKHYEDIACALFGDRALVKGRSHLTFENLIFQNGAVHGYQDIHAHHVTFRNCEFRFIGGAVYDFAEQIRFGNGIEFWDGASDILVEGCRFEQIYDSGVTHQGGGTRNIPERLIFRNNLFIANGMAAYECREPSREVYFEFNTCVDAGGGFSPQGEPPPRRSEIFPEPMGHHVFIWRIDPGTQPGPVYIRQNIFSEAPDGAMIYSCNDPVDDRHFVIDQNCYHQSHGELLMKLNGRSYSTGEFEQYRAETGNDAASVLADPRFRKTDPPQFQLEDHSPAQGMGCQTAPTTPR